MRASEYQQAGALVLTPGRSGSGSANSSTLPGAAGSMRAVSAESQGECAGLKVAPLQDLRVFVIRMPVLLSLKEVLLCG